MTQNPRSLTPRLFALVLAGGLVLFGACSDDDKEDAEDTATSLQEEAEDALGSASSAVDEGTDDAAETVARNLATEHGGDEFESAGHPLEGDLECEADASGGEDAVQITCTGATADGGQEAALVGTTTETPGASATELEGNFTGTVDGQEVFSVDRLGAEDDGPG